MSLATGLLFLLRIGWFVALALAALFLGVMAKLAWHTELHFLGSGILLALAMWTGYGAHLRFRRLVAEWPNAAMSRREER